MPRRCLQCGRNARIRTNGHRWPGVSHPLEVAHGDWSSVEATHQVVVVGHHLKIASFVFGGNGLLDKGHGFFSLNWWACELRGCLSREYPHLYSSLPVTHQQGKASRKA